MVARLLVYPLLLKLLLIPVLVEMLDMALVVKLLLRGPRGWTTLNPSVDSRLIYVASNGNNGNSGLDQAHPKLTVAAGKALLRNGFPDYLYLRRGDTFDEVLGGFDSLAGRSLSEPMVVTSYGSGARPILRTGTSDCVNITTRSTPVYLAFTDLEMTAHTYAGTGSAPNGFRLLTTFSGLLVEGCYIHNYGFGAVMQDDNVTTTNVAIRRNVVADIWYSAGGNACSGLYLQGLVSPLVEENVLDKAAWISDATWTIFFHTMYIHNTCVTPTVRNNVLAEGDGIQMRPGGTLTGNIVSRTRVSLMWGIGTNPNAGGITGHCDDNCVLEGHSPGIANGDSQEHCTGIRIGNVSGGTIKRNIFANSADTADPAERSALSFETCTDTNNVDRAVVNCDIADIIVSDWGGGAMEAHLSGTAVFSGNTLARFVAQSPNNAVCGGYYSPGPFFNPFIFFFTYGIPTSGEFAMDHCHFSRNATLVANHDAGGTHGVSYNNTSPYTESLPAFLTTIGATNSDTTVQTYPHSQSARLGDYYLHLGYTDQGSNDANHAAFMALCRLQRRGNWNPNLTAQNIRSYIVGYCFGSPW